MIVCVDPVVSSADESICSLNFATSANAVALGGVARASAPARHT